MADKEKVLIGILKAVIEDEGFENSEVKIEPISTGGANYASLLYAISIRSTGRDDLELFAKIACLGEQMRKEVPVDETYRRERFVYRDLAKIYDSLQKQHNIPDGEKFLFPKFYAYSDKYLEETVILENLISKGYTVYDRLSAVTWEYASAAVGQLAKFHALSYAFAENYPEEFDEKVGETTNVFTDGEARMFQMFKKSEATALEVVPDDCKMRLREFFDRECTMEKYKRNFTFQRRPVFVHGDYRPSNLMHKVTDGKLKELIALDYQTLHCGSPVTDLFYFIFCSTDGEFRSRHYVQLINHYYDSFVDFLKRLDLNPEKLYPLEEFREDLKEGLPFGLFIATFVLPVVLVEEENAPVMEADASMLNFIVKPNIIFQKRFCEILDDFIKWGLI